MGIEKFRQKSVFQNTQTPVLGLQVGSFRVEQRMARIILTAAQIKLLNTTPQEIVAAPGAGKYVTLNRIHGKLTFGTAAFTGANALEFRYTDGTGDKVAADMPTTGFLNISSATALRTCGGVEAIQTPVLNAKIVAFVPTANPGGATATGTLELIAEYSVITPT